MMPATQSESTGTAPPRLHRLFRFYDPEAIALVTILIGLIQVILGIPAYYLSEDVRVLYLCPVCVGAVHTTGGSLAFVCERSPSRKMLKNCLYSTLCGLLLGFCAIIMYAYSANSVHSLENCTPEEIDTIAGHWCPRDTFVDFFKQYALLMGIYAVAALILQFFLSISAIKDLNPTENLNVVKRKMDGHKPSNKAELLELSHQEWRKIIQKQCERLVEESRQRRMKTD